MAQLDIIFNEALCPIKNMERFKAKMLSIFKKYDRPFGNGDTYNLNKLDCEKPDGQGKGAQHDGEQHKPSKKDHAEQMECDDLSITPPLLRDLDTKEKGDDAEKCTGFKVNLPEYGNVDPVKTFDHAEKSNPANCSITLAESGTVLRTADLQLESLIMPVPKEQELEMAVDLNNCNNTCTDLAAKKAQDFLDIILTPIADKQGCIPLRNLSELEAGKRYSVDLDILIDDGNLPKYYELQVRPEQSDSTRKEKSVDFQKKHVSNIESLRNNGSYCFSLSPTAQSKQHFTDLQKDLYECIGNCALSCMSSEGRHQHSAEENGNHSITPADEESNISEINDSSLSDSYIGFIDLICRKANRSFASPLGSTRAKFYQQSNWFSKRRSLKLSKKRLNCSANSNLSLVKYVSTTKNWTNPRTMSRWPNKSSRNHSAALIMGGKNVEVSHVCHYGNAKGIDEQPQTTSLQPPLYYELQDKYTANAAFQHGNFRCYENTHSPRCIHPRTPTADFQQEGFHCYEQRQNPASQSSQNLNASFQQQDRRCTWKSLSSTSKSPLPSNVSFQKENLVCSNKTYSPTSKSPQNSKAAFPLKDFNCSEMTHNLESNSMHPLNEHKDFSRCEQADQYGLRSLQISIESEMNKTFVICSSDTCKTDYVRNEEVILPTFPTMMQDISSQYFAPDQPGQSQNNVASSDYERRSTLPKRLVLPFNLKNQLSLKVREKESNFDKIYRKLCMNDGSKLPKFKKAYLCSKNTDYSEGGNSLKSSLFNKKRKYDIPNYNSLIASAKRPRGEPSDVNSSDLLDSFFNEVLLFSKEHKTVWLPVNAESPSQASHMDEHANVQLKLNYDESQKMKDLQSFKC